MYYLLVYTSYTTAVASIKTAEAVGEHAAPWEPTLVRRGRSAPRLREDGCRRLALGCSELYGPIRGAGECRSTTTRMGHEHFTQLSPFTLSPHITGRKVWYLSDLPHLLVPANHSQMGVVTGPRRAGKKDGRPSAVTRLAALPAYMGVGTLQVLQLVEPFHSTWRVLRKGANAFPGSEVPFLFLNLAF